MYEKKVLPNGAKLIFIPQKETKAVTALVLFRVGSRYESGELNGVSHFIEHLMFKGTKKRPTTLAISRDLDSIGADYNAFTAKDHTGYYIKANKEKVGVALDVLSDILWQSKFSAGELEKERGVIIEEINMYEDTPMIYLDDLFEKNLYAGNKLGQLISGPKENIQRLKREEILGYKNKFYSPENMVVALAGNIGGGDRKLAEKYFGKIKAGGEVTPTFENFKISPKNFAGPDVAIFYKETEQIHLALGWPALSHDDPRIYALNLLGIILGGTMSSRLFINIREKKGLCYYISAGAETYEDTGHFKIQAGLDKSRIKEAIPLILAEVRKVLNAGVTAAELVRARDYLKGRTILALEDSSALASWFGRQELLCKEVLTPEEKFAKIDEVGSNDISAVAREVFQPDFLRGALIGPFKDFGEFRPLLKF
ncbi:MAG: pitrilysin family protein [Patescibacteria group bacterium]|nr:pitrilysin family protein [Patescibacteria group bacterium]MDD5490389.1 pitrilysin family protein [Patescibacteria group bacterium]